jgi:hypothetical protein
MKNKVFLAALREHRLKTGSITFEGTRYGYSRLLFAILPPGKKRKERRAVLVWPNMKHVEPIVVRIACYGHYGWRVDCPSCEKGTPYLFSTPLETSMRCMRCCDILNSREHPGMYPLETLRKCRQNPLLFTQKRIDSMHAYFRRLRRSRTAGKYPSPEKGLEVLMQAAAKGAIDVTKAKYRPWDEKSKDYFPL